MKNSHLIRIVVGSTLMLGVVATGVGASTDEPTVTLIPPATVERPVEGWEPWMEGHTISEIAEELNVSLTDNGSTFVETYEDGSGVQYVNGMEVRTFPSDTFVWDCTAMGNRTCGPTLPVTE